MKNRICILLMCLFCSLGCIKRAQASISFEGPVTDLVGVLTENEKAEIATKIEVLQDSRDISVYFTIVPQLNSSNIETYASDLQAQWNVHEKSKGRFLFVLFSVEEHQAQVMVGPGLKREISPAMAKKVLDEQILPALVKNNSYYEGFGNFLQALSARQISKVPNLGTGQETKILLHLLVVIFLAPLLIYRKVQKEAWVWGLRFFAGWILFVILVAFDSIMRPVHLEMSLYSIDVCVILLQIFKNSPLSIS